MHFLPLHNKVILIKAAAAAAVGASSPTATNHAEILENGVASCKCAINQSVSRSVGRCVGGDEKAR